MLDEPRSPRETEKWRVVRSALDNWGRTTRLCVIYLTLNIPADILILLLKH